MEDEIIYISADGVKVLDSSDYSEDLSEYLSDVPDVAQPLMKDADKLFSKIEKMLYGSPNFINLIKSSIPEQTLQAVLTDEQKAKIANGALKLMTKKDGSLIANLVNPETNKIVSTISLKNVNISPDISQASANFATQMQMAQIAEQIQDVQQAIEEVRQGQEYDRLSTAYSCQQKLLQAMEIKKPELKEMALLKLVSDAEDSRNLLMQSQKANLKYITEQPESFFQKMIRGQKQEKIDQRLNEIRESLGAVNMTSLVEAMAYQSMGEFSAARKSLEYYADYIDKTYLKPKGLLNRLHSSDSLPENYWLKTLPGIKNKIQALPVYENFESLEGEEKNGE